MKALDPHYDEVIRRALDTYTPKEIAEAGDTYPDRVCEMATGEFRPRRETREKIEDFLGESLTVEVDA